MEVIYDARADRRPHSQIRRADQGVEIKFIELPVSLIAGDACQVKDSCIQAAARIGLEVRAGNSSAGSAQTGN